MNKSNVYTAATLDLNLAPDYVAPEGELNNVCYLTLKYGVGWPMREADFAVIRLLVPGAVVGPRGIDNFVKACCTYAWDHIAGEPANFGPLDLFNGIKPLIHEWYARTAPEQRADPS